MAIPYKATKDGEDEIHARAERAVRGFLEFSLEQEQCAAHLRQLIDEKAEGFTFIDHIVNEYVQYLIFRGLEQPINRKRINLLIKGVEPSANLDSEAVDAALDAGYLRGGGASPAS